MVRPVDVKSLEGYGIWIKFDNGMEFKHWIAPGEMVKRVFGISLEQAKFVSDETSSP